MANTPRLGRASNRERMVVGFAFNLAATRVLLVDKKRSRCDPRMVGLLNGLGGVCIGREGYLDAMTREFQEEAGVYWRAWRLFAICELRSSRLYCYGTDLPAKEWNAARSTTDEPVRRYDVTHIASLNSHVYPDLRWLIPLAVGQLFGNAPAAIPRFDFRGL